MHTEDRSEQNALLLPLDVWRSIIRFIPDRHLQNLYGVNKLFYEAAMALRYREIDVDNGSDKKWPHIVQCPQLAHHVRTLTIRSNELVVSPYKMATSFYAYNLQLRESRNRPITHLVDYLWQAYITFNYWRSEAGRKSQRLQRDLPQFFHSLVNVDKLRIDCAVYPIRAPKYLDTRNPYLAPGWETFGANLRSLYVQIYSTYIDRLFAHKIHLERLEELTIHICPENIYSGNLGFRPLLGYQYNEMDNYSKAENIASFINAHAKTLNKLRLHAVGVVAFPAAFFRSVEHLPHLTQLGIGMPSKVSTRAGADLAAAIYDFVHLHHAALARVHWVLEEESKAHSFAKVALHPVNVPVDFQEWFSEELWKLALPKLDALTLEFESLPSQFGSSTKITEYIRRHFSKLTALHVIWGGADMKTGYDVAQGVFKTMSSNQLQDLKITVEPIYADVFAYAAARFPSLRKLELPCLRADRDLGDVYERSQEEAGIQQFKEDLAALDLQTDWPLTDLAFGIQSPFYPLYKDKEIPGLILQKLPRVETFNGKMRDEV